MIGRGAGEEAGRRRRSGEEDEEKVQ